MEKVREELVETISHMIGYEDWGDKTAEDVAQDILSLPALREALEKAEKWDSYQAELANEKTHTDRFISLMDAEEDELRRDAEKWRRLMALFDTSCDKCFLGHVCGTHRKAEAVCEDIKEAMETNDER